MQRATVICNSNCRTCAVDRFRFDGATPQAGLQLPARSLDRRICPGIVRDDATRDRRLERLRDWPSRSSPLGGLIVIKPALDHWDELYRGDPFATGHDDADRAEDVRQEGRPHADHDARRRRPRSRSACSATPGCCCSRLLLVALTAFLAAAVLHRAILGEYGLRRSTAAALHAEPGRFERGRRRPIDGATATPFPARNASGRGGGAGGRQPRPRASRSSSPPGARRSGSRSASWRSGPASATR